MESMSEPTTTLVSRPPGPRAPRRPPAGPPTAPPRPLTSAGVLAAAQSAGLGVLAVMVLVLVGWATAADSDASASSAVAGGLQVWLVGHHATLVVPGGSFSLAPLGLTALPVLLLHTSTLRAGRASAVTGRRGVLALTSAVTATYAVLAVAVALVARTDAVRPDPASAFLGAAVVAGLASGSAAVRATGRWQVLWHRLPGLARLAAPAALAAVAALLCGGALLAGLALAGHHGRAADLTAALDAGAGGSVLLLLGCLVLVPDAALWGVAFAAGPGFAVGAGTSVSVAGVDLGAVPALPLLAALPAGPGGGAGWLALLVPAGAGVLAGLVLRRTARRPGPPPVPALTGWRDDLRAAGLAGLGAGVLTAVLTGLSAGSAGPGRMREVGPDWWWVGAAVAAEVAVAAAAVLSVLRRRDRAGAASG